VIVNWAEFLTVIVSSLIAASLLVILFSLGLRLSDSEQRARKLAGRAMFVLCGLLVVFGIILIVPALRSIVLG
jgi:hypothetical protein